MVFGIAREERTGNTLYQELQFQEPDALAEMDEGADITGMYSNSVCVCVYMYKYSMCVSMDVWVDDVSYMLCCVSKGSKCY